MNGEAMSVLEAPVDVGLALAALRQLGAGQFDAVHLHYLEVLALRVGTCQDNSQRILTSKLAQALTAFKERFEQAHSQATAEVAQAALTYPQAATELQLRLKAGDFAGLKRSIATLNRTDQRTSLGDLVRDMGQLSLEQADARLDGHTGAQTELKSVSFFRNTWSKLSSEKQVSQALEQAPKNAGPMNSHQLVLRSLALMRDISPDYLNRFVSYVDTLLCLERSDEAKQAALKAAADAETAKKVKARRTRAK